MIVRDSNTRPVFGSVKPNASKKLEEALGQQEPDEEADDGRDDPDDDLDDHGAEHLAVRRPDRPQRRELARPLRDGDRERVRDDEEPRRAIPPNASRNARRNEMNSLVSAASEAACSLGRTCAFGGRICWISAMSWASVTFGFAATAISSRRPTFLKRRCAVGRSKPARSAPPIVRPERDWTMAETHSLYGPFRLHADRLADFEVLLARVLLVDRDLVGPGHWPSIRVRGLKTDRRSRSRSRVRRAPRGHRLPVVADELGRIESTPPSASATPGRARTFGRSDSSSSGAATPSGRRRRTGLAGDDAFDPFLMS